MSFRKVFLVGFVFLSAARVRGKRDQPQEQHRDFVRAGCSSPLTPTERGVHAAETSAGQGSHGQIQRSLAVRRCCGVNAALPRGQGRDAPRVQSAGEYSAKSRCFPCGRSAFLPTLAALRKPNPTRNTFLKLISRSFGCCPQRNLEISHKRRRSTRAPHGAR